MEIKTIIHKNYPIHVIGLKYSELDVNRCSKKFLSHTELLNNPDLLFYVKSDENGNIDYRGKNKEYRIMKINKIN